MDVFEIYERLWKQAQADGACVHYYTSDSANFTHDAEGATGWFIAHADDGRPEIKVYRLDCDDDPDTPSRTRGPDGAHLPPPDLGEELITLAHEYGHLRSFLGERARWNRYNEVAKRRDEIAKRVRRESRGLEGDVGGRVRASLLAELDDDARKRCMDEETDAWDVGRKVLDSLRMTDFRRYDERCEESLRAHRYLLGMDEARPSDLEEPLTTE